MKIMFESLIKRGLLYNGLKKASAPEIILQTEEKFLNEKVALLRAQLDNFTLDLEAEELEQLQKASPCYTCKNGVREATAEFKPLQCSKMHLMDDNNVEERIDSGCSDYDKLDSFPNFIEAKAAGNLDASSTMEPRIVCVMVCEKELFIVQKVKTMNTKSRIRIRIDIFEVQRDEKITPDPILINH